MMTSGMYSSDTPEWATPQKLFDELNAEFDFTLDPCATKENAKCAKFYTKEDDGLNRKWEGRVFCNPPYGRPIADWIEKAYESVYDGDCELVVCLVPARTDTGWWHSYCALGEIRFIKGRLKFNDGKNPAPFPSALVIFKK